MVLTSNAIFMLEHKTFHKTRIMRTFGKSMEHWRKSQTEMVTVGRTRSRSEIDYKGLILDSRDYYQHCSREMSKFEKGLEKKIKEFTPKTLILLNKVLELIRSVLQVMGSTFINGRPGLVTALQVEKNYKVHCNTSQFCIYFNPIKGFFIPFSYSEIYIALQCPDNLSIPLMFHKFFYNFSCTCKTIQYCFKPSARSNTNQTRNPTLFTQLQISKSSLIREKKDEKNCFSKSASRNISGTSPSPCLYSSLVERILTLLTSISEASIQISNGSANATSGTAEVDASACGTDSRSGHAGQSPGSLTPRETGFIQKCALVPAHINKATSMISLKTVLMKPSQGLKLKFLGLLRDVISTENIWKDNIRSITNKSLCHYHFLA
ncbi:hypothetical protein G5I_07109 [Acromyrmex echinatior]|uniref:Uncharacterized protein n=1 Tax=Acromyrmex echinatior TaxID=103372 RepID=F4WMX2_ACREC|nr:hypothetical protein G5I_07109 [Acromyrmex echinatior]